MSTRIFEKVADEYLSDHREPTPNHGFCGPRKKQNDVKESRKEEGGKGDGKDYESFCLYIGNLGTLKEA